ncbi:hypothetical protein [Kribbella jiaozuonensis]|uniref:DUF4333 domain-containing protein n=1 Tax=Kribbella jiaozuonensis TaxID=2575441 RepID=A0A4U3LWA1_9ACTN|nr:hypothetical protein [Kribbella jiaozuonensis]TKK79106.1 hypothetical protein FDA38_11780 [Kribbella jiaozuonensis]TKK83176.1 hypothetical protein FDA38_10735 [Kribbella jiaozuonensis]
MRLSRDRVRFGLAVFGLSALAVFLLSACSDSKPSAGSSPSASSSASAPSSAPIPTASTPSLTPLPTPSKPWPTPKVTGEPADDAPLASRITFAISKQAQIAAGKAATTTVKCPGIDKVETAGQHELTCTVTYAGKSYSGTLTVDAKQYSASYKFTSDSVAIVRAKVVDAVQRSAADAAKVTCTMDDVAVVKHSDAGIACDVTTTANAVQPYKAQVSGNGQVLVAKA